MSAVRLLRIGETLAGRYRLISSLGEGGFGVTYRAWDNWRGVPVVLKMPLAKHLGREVVLERFSREVARLRECFHPNIVPIIDDGHGDERAPYLVMRFLPGGSLADRKKPSEPNTLHYWLPKIANALDYIHGQGVLHRDVKPGNIFFDTRTNAFLGDFGIAKLLDDQAAESQHPQAGFGAIAREEQSLTRTGCIIGTAIYMPPEAFADRPSLTPQADQFSLAVTVYEMRSIGDFCG